MKPLKAAVVILYFGFSISLKSRLRTLSGCDRDRVFSGIPVGQFRVRSRIQCASSCSERTDCASINVCRDTDGAGQICEMFKTSATGYCFTLFVKKGCRYFEKENNCAHGHMMTPDGECECPLGCSGERCQNCIQDCKDGYNQHYEDDGIYRIWPRYSPEPFDVFCRMTYKLTYISARTGWYGDPNDHYKPWYDYKYGFGDLNHDYWLGLEKVYYILNQTFRYELALNINYGGATAQIYYEDIDVAAESQGYTLSYLKCRGLRDERDDAFVGSQNREFCTYDRRDCGPCPNKTASGWWFGNSCDVGNMNLPLGKYKSIYQDAPSMTWLFDGVSMDVHWVFLSVYHL